MEKEKSGDKREMDGADRPGGEPDQSLSELVRRDEREYPHGSPDRRPADRGIHIGL